MKKNMTLNEAIIKSLEDIGDLANYKDVFSVIQEKKYYTVGGSTPESTVNSSLGNFIRNGDSRVKRLKQPGGTYLYYLTKMEQNIDYNKLQVDNATHEVVKEKNNKSKTFSERDLHKLLSSYLKSTDIYSKTIFHEQSNGNDNNQTWTHPDMVGVKFLKLQSKTSEIFLKAINRQDTFKLSSYELKKEINTDSDLKKAFFQAVSNSSWANYGYLVAFEISDSLSEEMARLNQSFGIGIIELDSNPYRSKILFPATYREMDFKTIDKLCKMNNEFENFIQLIEKTFKDSEDYSKWAKKELDEFCDDYFKDDTEVEKYCSDKNIPTNQT